MTPGGVDVPNQFYAGYGGKNNGNGLLDSVRPQQVQIENKSVVPQIGKGYPDNKKQQAARLDQRPEARRSEMAGSKEAVQ